MLHDDVTGVVITTFYRVYDDLGSGFLESVYEGAMALTLRAADVKVERQRSIPVVYNGTLLGDFRADLVVEDRVVVEVKAGRAMDRVYEAQLLNYLRASHFEVGLLLNFGPQASFRRLLYTNDRKRQPTGPLLHPPFARSRRAETD